MASNRLVQVGRSVDRFQKESKDTSGYVSKNFPSVEESTDLIGRLSRYLLEFDSYNGASATLSITVFENLKPLPR
jgi:hypothetical protein